MVYKFMCKRGKLTMPLLISLILSLMATTAIEATAAVRYQATNKAVGTLGGTRFDKAIQLQYSKKVLASATFFAWSTFRQAKGTDRKKVQLITLFIESMNGVAYTSNNEIHVSADYIARYSGDVRTEIVGVLFHEVAHVWQWSGQSAAPGGLIEGIADFIRLKAGYAPSHWVKAGQGDRWDQGYDVTARFLDHCNGLKNGFVADLNRKMRDGYSDNFFVELLGKTVDQLWKDYKAKYGS